MHTNPKLELQILSTGHLAPYADNDIAECNRISGKFPHQPCTHLPPLDELPPGSTIIDAGAFIGDNTLEFVKRGWKVTAFEPFFDAYTCALANVYPYRADFYHGALGDGSTAILNYECPGTNHGMRSMKPGDGKSTLRIDDFKFPACDFIKLDVEGYEPFVLNGAKATITKFRPIMFIEANEEALNRYGWTIPKLEAHIRTFGYELEVIGGLPRFDWMCRPVESKRFVPTPEEEVRMRE